MTDIPACPAWNSDTFAPENHASGKPEINPFGEDVQNPERRTIPEEYRGVWLAEWAGGRPEFIGGDRVYLDGAWEKVAGVRNIPDTGIAVVTQAVSGSNWCYALRYFGLSSDGTHMVNLESADCCWRRE